MSAPQSYYWGKHRMASTTPLYVLQSIARQSSGLSALLTDRAMLGPVGRHAMPDIERGYGSAPFTSFIARRRALLDAQSIERCTVASLAAVQETQQ